ncbi:tetratricopeptide repeat protein [bacterium]|nr:tetratricopeptide repeat protein [bacterium]
MKLITPAKDRLAELKKQVKSQPFLFTHLADCYLVLGKPRMAAKILLKGLEQFPDNPMGWLVKGNLHIRLGQSKQAMTAFKQVLKLDNDICYAHEKCADLAREEGNSEWYIYHLQEINRIEPLDDEVRRKMDIEIMKRIAVEKGLFTRKVISDVRPEILRNAIMDRNLLPKDMRRKNPRDGSETQKPKQEEDSFDPFADIMQQQESEKIAAKKEDISEKTKEKLEVEDEIELGAWADHLDDEGEGASESALDDLLSQTAQEASASIETSIDNISEEGKDIETIDDEDAADYNSEDDYENESEESVDEDDDTNRKSPLMRMLAGEMTEQPASREVNFLKEDEVSTLDKPNLASEVLKNNDSSRILMTAKTMSVDEEELIKKQEDAQDRIAEIARSVMRPTVKSDSKPVIESENVDHDDEAIEATEDNEIDSEDDYSDIHDLVDDVLPHKEKELSEKPTGRVPTKTLAELYLSQGNLKTSIEVYEELVELHPDNEEFAERLQELNVKFAEEEENKEG